MQLSEDRIQRLLAANDISMSKLALMIGVSKGGLSNALAGRRGAGRKVLAGLLRGFSLGNA